MKFTTAGDLLAIDLKRSTIEFNKYWKSSSLPVIDRRKNKPKVKAFRRDKVLKKLVNIQFQKMVDELVTVSIDKAP